MNIETKIMRISSNKIIKYGNTYKLSSASSSMKAADLTFDLLGGRPRPRPLEALDLAEAEDFLGGIVNKFQKMAKSEQSLSDERQD